MTNEEKQALIKFCNTVVSDIKSDAVAHEDEIIMSTLQVFEIALAALTAPAGSLAELVPGEITYELAQTHCHRNDRPDITHGFHYGANWMRAAILRNIEEAK